MMPSADLFICGAREVITCDPGPRNPMGIIARGAVAVAGEKILGVGPEEKIREEFDLSCARTLDIRGRLLVPGFVDCHTHVVFGGSRAREFELRMTQTLAQVEAMGIKTGIPASIHMTRSASEQEIFKDSISRVDAMFLQGSTTIESKTGYGIGYDDEFRLLDINDRLDASHPAGIVSTFTGAHDFPPETDRDDPTQRQAYIDLLVNEMIPVVGRDKRARFCDIYCDEGYYTAREAEDILKAGLNAGLLPRIHTDAYANIGGSTMAARLPALTADHLNYTTPEEMDLMAHSGVIGVVLPALDFAVSHPDPVNGRALVDHGVQIALGTNLNPGNWTTSMQLVIQLACRNHGLSLAEALTGATMGGAKALAMADEIGSISPGKQADLQVWDLPSVNDLVYRIGNNAVTAVIKSGKIYPGNTLSDPLKLKGDHRCT
ncbi:MAG: imidazolonepropionase [Desulfobacterales bacterium]|nr:imidazolonepropionase [Desulfobacterales bacterium]